MSLGPHAELEQYVAALGPPPSPNSRGHQKEVSQPSPTELCLQPEQTQALDWLDPQILISQYSAEFKASDVVLRNLGLVFPLQGEVGVAGSLPVQR